MCVIVAAFAVAVTPSPGFADPKGGTEGDKVVIKDSETESTSTGDDANGSSGDVAVRTPEPYKEYKYIPACSVNELEGGSIR